MGGGGHERTVVRRHTRDCGHDELVHRRRRTVLHGGGRRRRPMLAAVEEVVAALDPDVRVVALDDARDPERAGRGRRRAARHARLPRRRRSEEQRERARRGAARGRRRAAAGAAVRNGRRADGERRHRCSGSARPTGRRPPRPSPWRPRSAARGLAVLADDTEYGQGLAAAVSAAARSVGLATRRDVDGTDGAFLAMGEVEQAVLMIEAPRRRLRRQFVSAEGGPDAPMPPWPAAPPREPGCSIPDAGRRTHGVRRRSGRRGPGAAAPARAAPTRSGRARSTARPGRSRSRPPVSATARREPLPRRRRRRGPRQLMRTRASRSA